MWWTAKLVQNSCARKSSHMDKSWSVWSISSLEGFFHWQPYSVKSHPVSWFGWHLEDLLRSLCVPRRAIPSVFPFCNLPAFTVCDRKSLNCLSDLVMGFKNIRNIFKEIEKPIGFRLGPFMFTSLSVYFYRFLFARVSPQQPKLDIYC